MQILWKRIPREMPEKNNNEFCYAEEQFMPWNISVTNFCDFNTKPNLSAEHATVSTVG